MPSPMWRCVRCSHEETFRELYVCPKCGGELSLEFDCRALARNHQLRTRWGRGETFWQRFAPLLPPINCTAIVTLGEGATPLVPAPRLAKHLGLDQLYLKLESCNPTGSFKDRQIAVAFSKAFEWGHRDFAIASSGNAAVSLAAFCARAACTAHVWVPQGTPSAKLCQLHIYGARVFLLPDPNATGDMVRYYSVYLGMQSFCANHALVPMITARRVNPLVVEGAKTIAFEIVLQLKRLPDHVFVPIGGGGLCGSTWKAFRELYDAGWIPAVPRVHGAQYGGPQYLAIDRIPDKDYLPNNYYVPLDGAWALDSIKASDGVYLGKVDHRISEAQRLLASLEGVFAEPAGAVATAGLLEAMDRGIVRRNELIVCYVTGHGLKNLQAAQDLCQLSAATPPIQVEHLLDSAPYFADQSSNSTAKPVTP